MFRTAGSPCYLEWLGRASTGGAAMGWSQWAESGCSLHTEHMFRSGLSTMALIGFSS